MLLLRSQVQEGLRNTRATPEEKRKTEEILARLYEASSSSESDDADIFHGLSEEQIYRLKEVHLYSCETVRKVKERVDV